MQKSHASNFINVFDVLIYSRRLAAMFLLRGDGGMKMWNLLSSYFWSLNLEKVMQKGTKEVQTNVFVKYECKVTPNLVLL